MQWLPAKTICRADYRHLWDEWKEFYDSTITNRMRCYLLLNIETKFKQPKWDFWLLKGGTLELFHVCKKGLIGMWIFFSNYSGQGKRHVSGWNTKSTPTAGKCGEAEVRDTQGPLQKGTKEPCILLTLIVCLCFGCKQTWTHSSGSAWPVQLSWQVCPN